MPGALIDYYFPRASCGQRGRRRGTRLLSPIVKSTATLCRAVNTRRPCDDHVSVDQRNRDIVTAQLKVTITPTGNQRCNDQRSSIHFRKMKTNNPAMASTERRLSAVYTQCGKGTFTAPKSPQNDCMKPARSLHNCASDAGCARRPSTSTKAFIPVSVP